MTQGRGRSRALALVAGTIGGLMLALYLWIMASEANNAPWQVVGWALVMALGCALALSPVVLPGRSSRGMLMTATAIFAGLGVTTSLGLGFMLAAALTGIAAYQHGPRVARRSALT